MKPSAFSIEVPDIGEPLAIAELRGREALSKPYTFDLDVVAYESTDVTGLLASPARVRLDVGGKARYIHGQVERIRRGAVLAGGKRIIALRLVPRIQRLIRRKTSRIFQDLTTREIVGRIFDEHRLPWRAQLSRGYLTREICIQHDETDLAFVTRLLAEEGISFRFEAPAIDEPVDTAETVVLFDEAARYRELPDGSMLAYRGQSGAEDGLVREEHHVSRFVDERREVPQGVVLRAFDFQRPAEVLDRRAQAARGASAFVQEDHGPNGEMQVEPQSPSLVLDQVRRRAQKQRGSSICARLSPGDWFELDDHDDPGLNGPYAITAVRHRARTQPDGQSNAYENDFTTVAKGTLLRPPRPPRRVRQSLETAVVTGPAGEEIYTDDLGRIKVQFHWDLDGRHDEWTSCWIRTSQSWAGSGWGAQFIPRIGMEVLVAFLGGDPDRPVVIGCLSNTTHQPAFQLPGNKTRTGWKSRSTPDNEQAGSSEIYFEDSAGAERVAIVAHRNFDISVKNEMHTVVTGESLVEIAEDHDMRIGGSHHLEVEGTSKTVFRGGAELEVERDFEERVSGDRSWHVEQDLHCEVKGSQKSMTTGQRKETVLGPWTAEAESKYTLVVGSPQTPGHAEVQVRGTSVHTTEGSAVIESHESLTLICGESRIEMRPEGITIVAPALSLRGKKVTVEGDGPAMRLDDRAEIVSDEVKVYGKESILELGTEATLKGKKIQFASGQPRPQQTGEEEDPTKQKLKLRFTDEFFEPYASKHYELRSEGVKLEGTTNAEGELEAEVPKTAKVAHIEIWTDGFPTGPRRPYLIQIGQIPDVNTLPGVRTRLKNLGYFEGPIDGDELDPATYSALIEFQRDHQLELTGKADPPTKATLVDRHRN
ncbi:MAG: type VI secretion system tip protein VgrG [Polyangiaceae bacterium]|nr:type VI secretion system tip protein VgrG [Polyangiaceae bacterium]